MIGITGFFIAVGIASAIFLMVRADRIRDRRRAYAASTIDTTCTSFRAVLGMMCVSLELLQRPGFPFASRCRLQYR
jgi:heme A synthase